MALSAIINVNKLDEGLILSPERYDPRRYQGKTNVTVSDVAIEVRKLINPAKKTIQDRFLVLDTGDANEGFIMTNKKGVSVNEIGSTKKTIQLGDVIISRLRPYLRQVALVDQAFVKSIPSNIAIACSTEFYVLRSKTVESIAFLVPLLLSDTVQESLFAAQEGGHHPRFNWLSLEYIAIPDWIIENKNDISLRVETAINLMRISKLELGQLISLVNGR